MGGDRQATWDRGGDLASPEPPSAVPQSLGVCICAEGFGGPDCATKLDGGQLVWETLMDSRLSAVSRGCHSVHGDATQPASWMVLPSLHSWDHPSAPTPSLTLRVPTSAPRTLPADSYTAWGTPWWRDLMPPCGCLGASACPRGCWGTCTGEDCLPEVGCLNERRSRPQEMLRCVSHKSPFGG